MRIITKGCQYTFLLRNNLKHKISTLMPTVTHTNRIYGLCYKIPNVNAHSYITTNSNVINPLATGR